VCTTAFFADPQRLGGRLPKLVYLGVRGITRSETPWITGFLCTAVEGELMCQSADGKVILIQILNFVSGCGVDSSGTGCGPVAGFCERCNDLWVE
jgi:hypothetical protein